MVSLCMELIFRLTLCPVGLSDMNLEHSPRRDFILKKIIPIEIDLGIFIFKFHFLCQLELSGVEPVQETDCDADSEFLMEIMEINEKLAEAKNEDNLEEIETLIKGRS